MMTMAAPWISEALVVKKFDCMNQFKELKDDATMPGAGCAR